MYRKIFNFAVTTITILTANLISSLITDKLISYKWEFKPLRFTLISMMIITIIFYPLFMMLQKWLDRLSRKFVKAGRPVAGKYFGLLVMFFIGLFILTCIYANLWYNINVLKLIADGNFLSAF
jgi:hypothetical protein